jgi:hypothetical protein
VSLNEVTLTLDACNGQLVPIGAGTAFLAPTAAVAFPGDSAYIWQTPVEVSLVPPSGAAADWLPTVTLVANDNSGGNPSSWEWSIAFQAPYGAPPGFTFSLDFAEGADQNLSGQVPTVASDVGYEYMPAPSGTPAVGDIPVYLGPGDVAWGTPGTGSYLPLTGGTLTGSLVIDDNLTVDGTVTVGGSPLGSAAFAATSAFDASGAATTAANAALTSAETYTSANAVLIAGSAMTGPLSISASESAGGLLVITNTHATPTAPSIQLVANAAADTVLGIDVTSDADYRFTADSNGQLQWGPGNAVLDTQLSRISSGQLGTTSRFQVARSNTGGGLFIVNNSSTPTAPSTQLVSHAAGDLAIGLDVSGDADYRLTIDSNGKLSWSSGSASSDATLARTGAGALTAGATLSANALHASEGASAGGVLQITNTTSTPTAPTAQLIANAAADQVLGIEVASDADFRFYIDSNGKMNWGSGSAATDTDLYRSSSDMLKTDNNMTVSGSLTIASSSVIINTSDVVLNYANSSGGILQVKNTSTPSGPTSQIIAHAAADNSFGIEVSGDADFRLTVDSNGKHNWGSGSAAGDTNLYRGAANLLQTDDSLTVGGLLTVNGGQPVFLTTEGLSLTAQGAQASMTGTVSLTTSNPTALASMTVPANDPVAGAIYELTSNGYFTSDGTSASLTLAAFWGATSLCSLALTPTASLTNGFWQCVITVTFVTSTTCNVQLLFTLNTAVGGGYAGGTHLVGTTTPVTVTVSSSEALQLQGTNAAPSHLTFVSAASIPERVY